MKIKALSIILCGCILQFSTVIGQKLKKLPEYKADESLIAADMKFLAADELMGRKTGEMGNYVAGRYIAEQFRKAGLKPINNGNYMQAVQLKKVLPPKNGSITIGSSKSELIEDFVLIGGGGLSASDAEVVQLPYAFTSEDGSYDDFKGIDVKGKIILTQMGSPDAESPQAMFGASRTKRQLAKEKGAIALIEIYTMPIPWPTIKGFFGKETVSLATEDGGVDPTHIWLNLKEAKNKVKENGEKMTISIDAFPEILFTSNNVVGVLEGTNPAMKDQYLALTAHYDHIGYGAGAGRITPEDSIFNGARDNAFGTTAVLTAVRAFTQKPTQRSILFIAYTGEELGLLGSKYYAENPLVPMKQVIFNLNCDGAGYNDKTKVTVIGLDRTSAEPHIAMASKAFGLEAINDPVPEQGLFDRSDNVSFAAKGVPAPNYAPGLIAFDDELNKYYHQAADNPDNIDYDYLAKYCKSYTYAARMIANDKAKPTWKAGDKYENAFIELYKD